MNASCEVISINKPPKVAIQGGLTSRPWSIAVLVLAGKLQHLQCEELFRCLGQRESSDRYFFALTQCVGCDTECVYSIQKPQVHTPLGSN